MAKNENESITCKYLPIYFGKQYRFYPIISVVIEHKFKTETIALVDSGSTNTFIPWGLAEAIGLVPDKKKKYKTAITTGAAGKFKTTIMQLKKLQALRGNTVFDTFRDIEVYIPSKEAAPLPHVVLGRDHLFKHFTITFYEKSKKMKFQRR